MGAENPYDGNRKLCVLKEASDKPRNKHFFLNPSSTVAKKNSAHCAGLSKEHSE